MENVAPFIPLELCEKDQKKMEDYFLARSSLPFKSLEMSGGGADMTLQAKITGALEISNGSIQALAPILCTASELLPSPLHGSCVIDGVLNYCKRLSLIKSQHQLSKTFTKSIGKCLKNQLGETFQVSPNPVRCEAKQDVTEVSPSGQNPLFCSTPAAGSVPTVATPKSNAYEECITTAQQSQVILTGNKETTFNSSMLIRSRRSMHRQETFRHTMGKENLKPLIEESDSNKRTPRSAFVCPKNSESGIQKNAKQEGLLLQFPPMVNTPKGRMSFQISGSVEWEN